MAFDTLAALHIFKGGMVQAYTTVAADGAITQKSGIIVVTKGSACALTIADPTSGAPEAGGDDGKILTIISSTAQAHTIDNSAGSGFNAGGAASDVATFSSAIGNNLVIMAYGGKWLVVSKVNATLA